MPAARCKGRHTQRAASASPCNCKETSVGEVHAMGRFLAARTRESVTTDTRPSRALDAKRRRTADGAPGEAHRGNTVARRARRRIKSRRKEGTDAAGALNFFSFFAVTVTNKVVLVTGSVCPGVQCRDSVCRRARGLRGKDCHAPPGPVIWPEEGCKSRDLFVVVARPVPKLPV